MKGEIKTLTSLRFFASAAIVICHFKALPGIHTSSALPLGVSFFFVLSGFVLAYAHRDGVDIKSFYIGRLWRLWPVHLFTLTFCVIIMRPDLLFRPDWRPPLVADIFLIQSWIPVWGYPFSYNIVSWSISAEILFYLLFPALMGRHLKFVFFLSTAITAGILAAAQLAHLSVHFTKLWHFSGFHLIQQFPPMRLMEFIVGVIAGRLFTNTSWTPSARNAGIIELVSILAVMFFVLLSLQMGSYLPRMPAVSLWLSQSGGMLFFAVTIFVFAHQAGFISRALMVSPLVLLGRISFSTYMVHYLIIKCFWAAGSVEKFGLAMTIGLIISTIYAVSYLTWRFIEEPCIAFGRKRFGGRFSATTVGNERPTLSHSLVAE